MVIAFIVAILVKLFEDLRVQFRVYTDAENAFDATVKVLGFDSSFVISMVLCTLRHRTPRPQPSRACGRQRRTHARAQPKLTTLASGPIASQGRSA